MELLVLILAILALAGAVLHAIFWAFVPTYRSPALLHLACICGFGALLVLALGR